MQVVSQLRKRHEGGRVNRKEFARVVASASGKVGSGNDLDEETLDVLYRVLDTDKDGLIDVTELEKHHLATREGEHGQSL